MRGVSGGGVVEIKGAVEGRGRGRRWGEGEAGEQRGEGRQARRGRPASGEKRGREGGWERRRVRVSECGCASE